MGLNKFITIIGLTTLVLQSIGAASVGGNTCFCTREYTPVCGTDDVTYSNICEFECTKVQKKTDVEIKFYGVCEDDSKPQIEDLRDAEVETLPVEGVEKMREDDSCACTFEYEPICGSDFKTYSSECEFNCAKRLNRGLEIFSKGECAEVETLPVEEVEKLSEAAGCVCTRIYLPVCGTDGNTYSNECTFNSAKKSRSDLDVRSMGECENAEVSPFQSEFNCMCTREYRPVCGSDQETYSNECMLNCARNTNENLKMEFEGKC